MADIELVIKIPEEAYRRIQALARDDYFDHDICGRSMQRIANGTPLTEEQMNLITDEEFEHTDRIWFDTPKGKHVEFVKAQQFTPCSEGLPKKRDWYLGIFKEPDTGWINPLPFICDYLLGTKTKATTKEGWILKGFTDREEYIDYYFNLECVAWMPLPKSYNGGNADVS